MVICKIIIQSLLLALLRAALAAPQPLLGMPKHQGMPERSPWCRCQSEQVTHAVAGTRLSQRCWLVQSSTSSPPRAPVSLRVPAMPLLRKCYSSRVLHQEPGGGRASHSAYPAMNKHRYSFCPSPGLGSAVEQGQEGRYFWE